MQIIDELLDFQQDLFTGIDASRDDILYFDIETTGFSPANTTIYLIGCIYHSEQGYMLRQWFADTKDSEAELLTSFLAFIKSFKVIVHYNGTGFDIPYIIKKCRLLHIPCDFNQISSMDIYKIISPVKSIFKLENLKQKSVETFMGVSRNDQYSGGELIRIYHEFLSTSREDLRALLLLHNHDDVIGMVLLLPVINYTCFINGEYQVVSMRMEESVSAAGLPRKELLIELALDRFLAKRVSFGNDFYYCTACGNVAKICIQVYTEELKYFYPNYKDYYYLPAEDRSIHKSVAFYVDKEFRTKAKAANCYSKCTGTFLPQYEEIISPYFRIDFYDKISYFEYADEFKSDASQIADYIRHIFHVLIR